MEFLNNITQGRGKVITSALAAVLATLIFLADIHIVAKIVAVIALTVVAACLILSLIQKTLVKKNDVSTQTEEQSDILGDEGYSTGDETEEDMVISAEERENTEAEVIKERTEREMKDGLPENMDLNGNQLPDQANVGDTQSNSPKDSYVPMESLPTHMDALGNSLPEKPNTNISMEAPVELSSAGWLSRYGGNITNNLVRTPERLTMEYILSERRN